jgi:DNA-binding transcriptional ArsR family regulator
MVGNVRRLAPPQLDPLLEIVPNQAAETIVSLNMVSWRDLRCENYDVGREWFDQSRTMMSAGLRERLAPFEAVEATHALWLSMLGALADAPGDVRELVRHLESMPTEEFWLQALGFHDHPRPSPELREAILAAGRGSLEPLERLNAGWPEVSGRWIHGLARALGGDAGLTQRLVADLVLRWHAEVFSGQWPDIAPVLERDAVEKRRLARTGTVAEVVEEATNGGEYVPEVGVRRLLLIPTYLGRPWVIRSRQRETLVMVYPVGDAALTDSPEEARRRRVQRLAKALSDDTRLRALRLLAASGRSLQELADELGIRKSTMHHHLAVLRSAGLLRIRFNEKRYSLRTGPLAEMSGLLGDYLGTTEARSSPRRRG